MTIYKVTIAVIKKGGKNITKTVKCNFEDLPREKHGGIDWWKSIGLDVPFQYENINGIIKITDYGFEKNKVKIEYKNNTHILLNSSFRYGMFVNFINKVENIEKFRRGSAYNETLNITDPWVEEYFQEKDKHYFYKLTKGSGKKFNFICPNCKIVKRNKVPIYQVVKEKGIKCHLCNDNFSYPNKFAYNLFCFLEELNIILNYECEYSPKWARPYRYDNYFIYNNQEYIIEFDGSLGHGNKIFGENINKKDIEGLNRDLKKNELAKENNCILIRVDVNGKESDFKHLKDECINNVVFLKDFIDKINWEEIEVRCQKNIYSEINNYYMDTHESVSQIAKKFKVSIPCVLYILKTYSKLNLNDYKTFLCKYKEKYKKVIEMNNNGLSVNQIEIETGIQSQSIIKYLKRAEVNGEAIYTPYTNKKKVNVYKDGVYIKTYESISKLSRDSKNDLGVNLDISEISYVCNGKNKQAKGYTFSFVT